MILPRIKTAVLEARTRLWLAWRALTTNHWERASQSVQAELRRRNELEWQYSRGYLAGWSGRNSSERLADGFEKHNKLPIGKN